MKNSEKLGWFEQGDKSWKVQTLEKSQHLAEASFVYKVDNIDILQIFTEICKVECGDSLQLWPKYSNPVIAFVLARIS